MRSNYGPRWFTHWTAGISWFLTLLALLASWYVFQRLPDMIPAHGQGSLLMPKGPAWFLWPWFMAVGGVVAVLPYLVRDANKWLHNGFWRRYWKRCGRLADSDYELQFAVRCYLDAGSLRPRSLRGARS